MVLRPAELALHPGAGLVRVGAQGGRDAARGGRHRAQRGPCEAAISCTSSALLADPLVDVLQRGDGGGERRGQAPTTIWARGEREHQQQRAAGARDSRRARPSPDEAERHRHDLPATPTTSAVSSMDAEQPPELLAAEPAGPTQRGEHPGALEDQRRGGEQEAPHLHEQEEHDRHQQQRHADQPGRGRRRSRDPHAAPRRRRARRTARRASTCEQRQPEQPPAAGRAWRPTPAPIVVRPPAGRPRRRRAPASVEHHRGEEAPNSEPR